MEKQDRKLYFRAAVTLLVMLLTTMTAWADNPDWLRSGDSWDDATKTLIVNSTSVANNAYRSCSEIVNVVFSDNVTDIGNDAFAYCTGLTTVTFGPNSHLEYIGSKAFYDCNNTGFISIEIPAGVTTISNSAFFNCSSLATITFAEGSQLEYICESAFFMCSALSAVTIPASVQAIGDYAFQRCNNLTSVTIPDGVQTIGESVFRTCPNLTDITVDAGNAYYASEDGVLFDKDKSTLIRYPEAKSGTAYTIPASVETVVGFAFNGCSNLTSVIIPDGVQIIGQQAFNGCSALTSVTIPASVTEIGNYAFGHCSSLKTVYSLPIQAPELGRDVFDYFLQGFVIYVPSDYDDNNNPFWSQLRGYLDTFDGSCGTNVYYLYRNGTLTIVGTGAMENYDHKDQPWKAYRGDITSVVIENGVTDIGNDAFTYCTGLTTVTFGPNSQLEYIGSDAFYGCNNTGFISIEIPAGVTTIGNSAFLNCSSLATITFAEGSQLEYVGRMAFYVCSALSAVTFPASVKAIGEDAFTRCNNLTDITVDAVNAYYASEDGVLFDKQKTALIRYPQAKSGTAYTIPASVKTVAGYAFYGCSTLASVIIPDGVQTIGEHAFDCCSALTSVIIPDGVTEIGDYTFDNCSNLTSVIIPDGVQTIGEAAFAGCSALTSVTIPASVTSIGMMAFSGCSSLKTVYSLPIQAPELGWYVFNFFPQGFVVYVPSNSNGYYQCWGDLRGYLDTFDGSCGTNVYYLYRNGTLTIVGTGAMTDYETPEDQPWKAYREDITSVVIENGVTGIGINAFVGCSNLTDITVDAVNAYYASEDGVLFDKQKTTLIQYPQAKSGTAYTIPANVTSIGTMAFYYCTSLSSIILNSNPFIGSDAFYLTPATVTMNLTGNEGETGEYWTTFYNENYNFQVPAEGTQVFKAALGGSTLALTELTTDKIVTKNNAVILKSTSGPIALTLTSTDGGNDFTGNSLLGVSDPNGLTADDPSTAYVLNKKNNVVGFYKLKAGKKAGVGKAYLTYGDALTKEFFGFEDDATSLSEELRVKSEEGLARRPEGESQSSTAVYDLSGRRISNSKFSILNSQLPNGLYIVNGKKVFIK